LNEPRPAKQIRARFFVAPDGAVTEKFRPLTERQRRDIFSRDHYRCQICGHRVSWLRWESRNLLS